MVVLSSNDEDVLKLVGLGASALSILACATILCSWVLFGGLRTYPYKLITYLILCEFVSSVAYPVGLLQSLTDEETSSLNCKLAGGLSQFFDVASFCWVACIAYNVYAVLGAQRSKADVEGLETWYHALCWSVAAVSLSVPAMTEDLGFAGNWCWIEPNNIAIRFSTYYLPMTISFIASIVLYRRTVSPPLPPSSSVTQTLPGASTATTTTTTTTTGSAPPSPTYDAEAIAAASSPVVRPSVPRVVQFRLLMYIVAFAVLRIPSVVNRVHNAIYPDHPSFILFAIHTVVSPLQGLVHSVIYGLNTAVRRHCGAYFQGCCLCPMASDSSVPRFNNFDHLSPFLQEETRHSVAPPRLYQATTSNPSTPTRRLVFDDP